jgi:hypothetical protein
MCLEEAAAGTDAALAAGSWEGLDAGGRGGSPSREATAGGSWSAGVRSVSVGTRGRDASGHAGGGGKRSDDLGGGAPGALAGTTATFLVVDGSGGLSRALREIKLVCNVQAGCGKILTAVTVSVTVAVTVTGAQAPESLPEPLPDPLPEPAAPEEVGTSTRVTVSVLVE